MAVALASNRDMTVHVVHDERVAAFVALGIGLDGVPAVLLCTSGTAAANFHPAVVEAGLSDGADAGGHVRPAAGAPRRRRARRRSTRPHLFGRSVRWFHDPGVPDAAAAPTWRSLAFRASNAARVGPVHLNLPFREPLTGSPGELPPRLDASRHPHRRHRPGSSADGGVAGGRARVPGSEQSSTASGA